MSHRLSALTGLSLAALLALQPVRAQFVVFDPANFGESIMTELNTLTTTVNQITQIAHQITQISNEIKNLQQFPKSISGQALGQYVQQYTQLVNSIGQINGIAQNVTTLTQKYNSAFPNTPVNGGNGTSLTPQQINAQVSGYLTQTRSVYQGAYSTQAQVMQSLGADSANIQSIATQSGASSGNLDAQQASAQLQTQIASQLLKLNQQMATMNQAQLTFLAQQAQQTAQSQQEQAQALVGWTTPSTATPHSGLWTMQ
jgi:P-type conjugative transfer protein TrbJ